MDGGRRSGRRRLLVNAVELLRDVGATKHIETEVGVDDLGIDDERLDDGVAVDVTLESTFDRVLATGAFTVDYHDTCSRCLTSIHDRLTVTTSEQYTESRPADDPGDDQFLDSFPIENGQIDLAPMVRESLLLAIPDAPLCRDDCRGLCPVCGADLNVTTCDCDTTIRDDRWSVLDQLRNDET